MRTLIILAHVALASAECRGGPRDDLSDESGRTTGTATTSDIRRPFAMRVDRQPKDSIEEAPQPMNASASGQSRPAAFLPRVGHHFIKGINSKGGPGRSARSRARKRMRHAYRRRGPRGLRRAACRRSLTSRRPADGLSRACARDTRDVPFSSLERKNVRVGHERGGSYVGNWVTRGFRRRVDPASR